MAKSQVQFTKDNEYYTPKKFVERFGKFDYDPATTKEKAEEFGILNFDTIETDGLSKDWTPYKRIWVNPPFTRKHEFLSKAFETYKKARNDIYILFPIEFLTTAMFHITASGGKIFIPNGRINFESGVGKKGRSAAFGSVVMKLQDTWEIQLIER
jgi:phage N-6-adenine-methyltransferase